MILDGSGIQISVAPIEGKSGWFKLVKDERFQTICYLPDALSDSGIDEDGNSEDGLAEIVVDAKIQGWHDHDDLNFDERLNGRRPEAIVVLNQFKNGYLMFMECNYPEMVLLSTLLDPEVEGHA